MKLASALVSMNISYLRILFCLLNVRLKDVDGKKLCHFILKDIVLLHVYENSADNELNADITLEN